MGVLASDGLSLWVGDGAVSESFTVLRGAEISRLEIHQVLADDPSIASDTWKSSIVTSRRATVECHALATNEAQGVRVRTLAMNGAAGNFKLAMNSTDDLQFGAHVTHYREITEAGAIKRIEFRLESSDAAAIG